MSDQENDQIRQIQAQAQAQTQAHAREKGQDRAGQVNHGIQQYGGHSQVGNQAVGQGARAEAGQVAVGAAFTGEQSARVEELLTRIELLLDQHQDELADTGAPRVELRRLREELAESEPQPGVLRRALDRLTAIAEPVVPLATAVGELARLVQGG
ncbi:hypothetical protein [Streptomyces sp. NPDC056600]|uniref:hypothetical protein n=1 Tax=Streptomyces sp. NPDC056600 TaxID=3345874 RepID=UPI0036B2BC4E